MAGKLPIRTDKETTTSLMRQRSFRHRLLALGISLSAVPLLLFGAAVWRQNRGARNAAAAGCMRLADSDLDHMASNIYMLCETNRAVLEHSVRQNLQAARLLLERAGGVHADPGAAVSWEAQNQFTKARSRAWQI